MLGNIRHLLPNCHLDRKLGFFPPACCQLDANCNQMGTNHQFPDKSERNHFGWIKPEFRSVPQWQTPACLTAILSALYSVLSVGLITVSPIIEAMCFCRQKYWIFAKTRITSSCNTWMVMIRPRLQEDTHEMSLGATGGVGEKHTTKGNCISVSTKEESPPPYGS